MKKLMFGGSRSSRHLSGPAGGSSENRPSGEQLNKAYKQLLEELAIPQAKRDLMLKNESDERKWQLIQQHSAYEGAASSPVGSKQQEKKNASFWVSKIMQRNRKGEPSISVEEAGELYAVLRTAHKQFLIEFIDVGGVDALIELTRWFTGRDRKQPVEKQILPQIMSCYKALMNNNFGMEGVLAIEDSISSFALGMDLFDESDLHTAQEVVMMLAVTCFYSPEGREMVVRAMDDLRIRWREKQRYQTLVETFSNCTDNAFRAAVIMFITTLVNSAAEVENRVAVRNDFLSLDIMRVFERVMDEAKEEDDESYSIIATQYQVFEDMMAEDHREVMCSLISGEGDDEELDLSDQSDLFEYLVKSTRMSGCAEYLLDLSQSLLLIPTERSLGVPTWEAIVQFVREATDYSRNPRTGKRVRINYQLLGELLDKRNELDAKLSQLSSGDDIIVKQRKKIQDLQKRLDGKGGSSSSSSRSSSSKGYADEASLEEIEILQDQVKQLKEEISSLQKELAKGNRGKPVEDDVEDDRDRPAASSAAAFNGKLDSTGLRPAGLIPGVKPHGIPACPLPGMPGSLELAPIPTKSGSKPQGAPKPAKGSAPSPPVSFAGAGNALVGMLNMRAAQMQPPKAPAGAVSSGGGPAVPVKTPAEREAEIRKKLGLPNKKTIEPSVKMRHMYWTAVPVEKLEGTIWPELSDQKIKFSSKKLEKMFGDKGTGAKGVAEGGDANAEKRKSSGKVHLVTGKRQQNVGIALSKMRAADEDIAHAVIAMDETLLTPNHTQLLLTCVPTDDEIELIKNFEATNGDIKKLAREDRFLRVMSQIPRLQQRLQAMMTKHNFESDFERIFEKVQIVRRACAEIDRSSELKKLLEIVLAIGNYINGGTPRGGAWGFKLDALQKLDTIKDNSNKKTLMDFLHATLEENYPELLGFQLPHSKLAVEVSLTDTMTELNQLASAMRSIKTELEQPPLGKSDRFHKVMAGFEVKAAKHVSQLQEDFEKVRGDFQQLAKQYAESGPGVEPESFFSKFVRFQIALERAQRSVEDQREREERARRLAQEKERMRTLKRLKELEAQGADEGVFDAFVKANAGNAQDIVQGFLARHKEKKKHAKPPPSRSASLVSEKSTKGKKKKKKPETKIILVPGPDGKMIEKRVRRKKKKQPASSVPNADYDMA